LGAIAITLPSVTDDDGLLRDVLSLCDGIIFTGGPDVRPSLFGEEIIPSCGAINDERDAFEIKLYKMAIEADKSILGICRGVQVMNIAEGGNIYQDIYSQSGTLLVHHTLDSQRAFHSVTVTDERVLEKIGFSQKSFTVNSYHHQSVKDLADGYVAAAYSPDGLIEAIYMPERRFVAGVQWHPEKRFEGDNDSFRILIDFVESCKK
jgi:putative glutamine amidotransferase